MEPDEGIPVTGPDFGEPSEIDQYPDEGIPVTGPTFEEISVNHMEVPELK